MYSSPPSNQSAEAGAFSTAARSDRRGAPLLRLANGGTATERLRVSRVRFPSRLPCGEQQTGAARAWDRFRGGEKKGDIFGMQSMGLCAGRGLLSGKFCLCWGWALKQDLLPNPSNLRRAEPSFWVSQRFKWERECSGGFANQIFLSRGRMAVS